MMAEFLIPLSIITGLGLLFGIILAFAYTKFKVYEDPRLDVVSDLLPGANCGACGEPGCRAFAEKVVSNEVNPSKCTVSSTSGIQLIADYLGVEPDVEEKQVARLLCAGGINESHNVAQYDGGLTTCRGEAVVAGGIKECSWGCLGLGDCEVVCDFDAIRMNSNSLPIVDAEKCTACGDCVEICPKGLFELMPVSQQLIVQCRSLLEGEQAISSCRVACTGCSRCVSDSAPGVIKIKQNLAVIDYELNHLTSRTSIKRCPTDAIV
ncbi:MAG: RnfABCDGE type electron transport complex subunit B, partial [Bacteroidia bacterium]|nr:RnfABCDGE type electron transport complex subunit B [Bacteroidia bacterium]